MPVEGKRYHPLKRKAFEKKTRRGKGWYLFPSTGFSFQRVVSLLFKGWYPFFSKRG
jgi:hypothetical protein